MIGLERSAGLSASLVQGTLYRHETLTNQSAARAASAASARLYVFLEGDGSPWSEDGQRPAADPTPHEPLGLELAARSTDHTVLYVGRPCYFSAHADPACTPDLWTGARYSTGVVDSMAAVVNRYVDEHGFAPVVLVGYSGGGTLAVLMAPRIPSVRAVVTIAANLDVAAWTRLHGYLPLTGSLDPSTQPPLESPLIQIHLVGGHDSNVPGHLNQQYLRAQENPQIWQYPSFDHVCCWVKQWPTILKRLDASLSDSKPGPRADR